MSKLLIQASFRALVSTYTWTTLPLYTIVQRPWRRLRLAKSSFNIRITKDSYNRTIYSRPTTSNLDHPYLKCNTYNEILELLDRHKPIMGVRDVISEVPALDQNGALLKVDGRELKKIKLADHYRWYRVGEILDRVDALARGLCDLGVTPGEKVIIYAENSFEWFCSSLALIRLNATTVTLLSILNDEGIRYGINQSEAKYLIISQDLLARLHRISGSITRPLNVVYIANPLAPNDPEAAKCIESLKSRKFTISSFEEIQAAGARAPPQPFPSPKPEDVALIMYTSGTTGVPKGVMLTHKNLMTGFKNLLYYDAEIDTPLLNSRFPAYLPMAHLYGYVVNLGLFITDSRIALCSPLTMLDSSPGHVPGQVSDFALIRPEFIGGVPLVLERILKEIYRKLHARSPHAAPLFTYLMDYKIRWRSRGYDTPIINRLVCRKINAQFGGRLRTILTGSASLSERTQALVEAALDVRIIQGYGSTEMTAASHLMARGDIGYGQCGVPLHSVRHYLKDWPEGGYYSTDRPNPRGEIVVGGDSIAAGYYKMPEATAEAFSVDPDGTRWFESGDIVEMLPNGTLKVIDRKKDLTKLANGEFVSLGKIESGLRSSPYVENICICTSPYSNHVTALVSPNRKSLAELGASLSKSSLSFDQLCADPEIISHVQASFKRIGAQLGFSAKELPATITLVTEEWTQDNGLLTAAMKMKRKQVNEFYRRQIDAMFDRTKSVE